MGRVVEKKKKKKGRPSLLDLQKRSLRLQKQQEQQQPQRRQNPNPNLSTNPYARFPRPTDGRLPTQRNSISYSELPSPEEDGNGTAAAVSADDDNDEDEHTERRKEKKLKHVLHLPHLNANSADLASSTSESLGAEPKKRTEKSESKNSSWKATETPQEEKSDLGPTTPLPDKKLLDFILDRLQKKDTYGVFSEPVDPEELPDYYDIIEHPMDFGTVRKWLSIGAYQNLEQFERDVLLICSNAMCYNAPDTVYFRQARSIQELAKKSFENLRQESDGSEPETKVVRRGRPPGTGRNSIKRPVGRPPVEHVGFDCSLEASLATALNGNLSYSSNCDPTGKASGLHKQREDASARCGKQNTEKCEDYSGSGWKVPTKCGRKVSYRDENRQNTRDEFPQLPVPAAVDGDRKTLVPVGLPFECSYARSLARFAANLGPIGWEIAAGRIEKVLSPGTKFGRGWVGDSDSPQQLNAYHPPSSNPSHHRPSRPSDSSSEHMGDECSKGQGDRPSRNGVEQRSGCSSEHGPASQLHYNRTRSLPVDEFKAPFGNPSSSCGQYSFRLPQQQFSSAIPCSPASRWGDECQPSS